MRLWKFIFTLIIHLYLLLGKKSQRNTEEGVTNSAWRTWLGSLEKVTFELGFEG